MDTIYEEYLDQLNELHEEIKRILGGLPQPAIDWSPRPGMNSIGVLVAHLAGAERYWLSDIIAQTPTGRDRDSEFRTREASPAELTAMLDAALEATRQALESLTLAELAATRIVPRDNSQVTVANAMLHVFSHTTLHTGQVELNRDLWELSRGKTTEP
jgi:uncharacterized damage-inducible protein DinB